MKKFTNEQVKEIIVLAADLTIKRKDICKQFGMHHSSYTDIVMGRTHKDVPRPKYLTKVEQMNNLPRLTTRQLEIISGSLLGDGSISRNNKGNCSFKKSQSIVNEEYVFWHSIELNPYSRGSLNKSFHPLPVHNEQRQIVGYSQKKSEQIEFASISHSVFSNLRDKWYPQNEFGKNKKIVPSDLVLTPLMIAVWFCDDGSNYQKYGRAKFCTNGFDKKYVDFLANQLFEKYNIENNVFYENTGYVIVIRRKSYLDFIEIIKPFITFDCLKYKVDTSLYVPPKFFKKPYHHKRTYDV